jgi:hypothetical protein
VDWTPLLITSTKLTRESTFSTPCSMGSIGACKAMFKGMCDHCSTLKFSQRGRNYPCPQEVGQDVGSPAHTVLTQSVMLSLWPNDTGYLPHGPPPSHTHCVAPYDLDPKAPEPVLHIRLAPFLLGRGVELTSVLLDPYCDPQESLILRCKVLHYMSHCFIFFFFLQ